MSRSTTLTFRQAINARETDQALLLLLEIDHDDLASPIRITSDGTSTTSNGDVYVPFPFEITLPSDSDESVPTCQLKVSNVGRELTEAIRGLMSPPTVRIMVVLASAPDTLEADFSDFLLKNITYDAEIVTGNITVEDFMNEPIPGDSFVPSLFPGCF